MLAIRMARSGIKALRHTPPFSARVALRLVPGNFSLSSAVGMVLTDGLRAGDSWVVFKTHVLSSGNSDTAKPGVNAAGPGRMRER